MRHGKRSKILERGDGDEVGARAGLSATLTVDRFAAGPISAK
jgi:hypothetical protein